MKSKLLLAGAFGLIAALAFAPYWSVQSACDANAAQVEALDSRLDEHLFTAGRYEELLQAINRRLSTIERDIREIRRHQQTRPEVQCP